jgi:hypothetical protein
MAAILDFSPQENVQLWGYKYNNFSQKLQTGLNQITA